MCNQGDAVGSTWIWNFQPMRRRYIMRTSDDVHQASFLWQNSNNYAYGPWRNRFGCSRKQGLCRDCRASALRRKMYIFGNSQQRMHAPSEGNPAVRSVRLVVSQNIFQSKSKSLFQHGPRVKYLPQSWIWHFHHRFACTLMWWWCWQQDCGKTMAAAWKHSSTLSIRLALYFLI